MFNSTLTGNARVWFDKLPKESIDSYEDLRTAFRENYLQQTKHIKDPVEIHHIKQRDGESTEDFMERYKAEVWTHHGRRKASSSWKPSEGGDKPTFKKGFKNKQRPDRKPDRFSLLTKTPKEIFALEKGKFKAPPPMELKQNDKPKASKKGEAPEKDKPLTILMIQPWERVAKPRITQSFSSETAMSFPPLSEEDETKSPMIIEVEMGGHFVHRVYIDGGASSEVLYEHCFIKLRKEIRDQMVPATTHLIGFSGETIWPLGQIALLVKIGDEAHSTSAWMNFMVIRSPSQHNAIIGRPGIRKIRAVPSTAHGMLKFPVEGGTEGYSPVRQKKRGQAPERNKAIQEEVEKLVDAGIMKEVDVDTPVLKESYVKKEIIRVIQTIQTFEDNTEIEPKKCTFGMQEGMFLGYKVSTNGLKACPDKADAVLSFAISEMHQGQLLTLTAPREREELIIPWLPAKEATARSDDGQRRGNTVYFSEISGRMLKWKFELEGYDIQYRPRTAIKGQILADFIVERPEEESPDELMAEPEVLPEPWTLFTDGSSCVDGSGAGLILINPEGAEFTYAMRFRFDATNNEAEYEALIAGLRIAEKMGIKNLQANVDSRLVANQVNGSYIAKESGMVQYLNKVKTLAKSFKEFSIKQIPRSENKKADALSKIASTSFAHLNKQVLVEELKEKSINEEEILDIVEEEGNTWMTPIQEYLTKEILPEDKKKARAVRRKAAKYAMINGTLYKKSFLGPWLRCVGPLQANYVLREIHEGSCSMHSGPRSVVAKNDKPKAPKKGEASEKDKPLPILMIQPWERVAKPRITQSFSPETAMSFPPLSEEDGTESPMIVEVEMGGHFVHRVYIDGGASSEVLYEHCFVKLRKEIRDQMVPATTHLIGFSGETIWPLGQIALLVKIGDEVHSTSAWMNFMVIRSPSQHNAIIGRPGIRKIRAVPSTVHGMLKFPVEGGTVTLQSSRIIPMECAMISGPSTPPPAAIQEAKSKKKMEKYYNSRVRGTSFKPGDMVYRSNEASHAQDGGKLGPKWEGPYEVKESLGKGAYKLKDRKGNDMPRTWNICNLKKCYIHEM
ncbi:reverse transcriptase domain-containing protein [Tanacetum coccineum]